MTLSESYFCITQYLKNSRTIIFEFAFPYHPPAPGFTIIIFTSLLIDNKRRLEVDTRTDTSHLYVECL